MIGIIFSTTIFNNLNNLNFCKKYLYYFYEEHNTIDKPILELDSYLNIIGYIFIGASVILLFISETPFIIYDKSCNEEKDYFNSNKNEKISMKDTLQKIKYLFKNKILKKFIGILLISKIGQTFSLKLTGLILIEQGYPQENLTNISPFLILADIFFSIKFCNIKEDFLKHYLKSYKCLFLVFSFEILILTTHEFNKELIEKYNFIFLFVILAHSLIKSYFVLICFISISGFFHKITDRSIGATYITALNSSNNLSEKWPGIFIFFLVDYINYKIIGFLSILYCIWFYLYFKDTLIEFNSKNESEWLSFKIENKVEEKKN